MACTNAVKHEPQVCFRVSKLPESGDLRPPVAVTLRADEARALGVLLPLLTCGEEAAALAFEGLSGTASNCADRAVMRAVAAEEYVHDRLLKQLQSALPVSAKGRDALRMARRFHVELGRGGSTYHLAKIAAIDAAVCIILTRLLRPGTPVSADRTTREIFSRIRSDEARHVRVSRGLVLATGVSPALRNIAAAARANLAQTLMFGGEAFDTLQVDPDRLLQDIRHLPNGMFAP